MLKPVLFQPEHDVRGTMNQVKERFFSGRNAGSFRVRDQDVDVCRRQIPECLHDPLQALPAFLRLHLFIVIGVEQSEKYHERAGSAAEETGKFRRDGGFRLKRRKRPCEVCFLQQRPRRKRKYCRNF